MHAHHHQLTKPKTIPETKLTTLHFNSIKTKIHRSIDLLRLMEVECMRAVMKKLTIFYTPNFKPIITHNELDHIMSTLGFVPHPLPPPSTTAGTVIWKEYSFSAAGTFILKSTSPPPRPRLPYPRIDGLHVNTYRDFLESVNFYLRMNNISDLFHIRSVFYLCIFYFQECVLILILIPFNCV